MRIDFLIFTLFSALIKVTICQVHTHIGDDLLIVGVATDETDGYKRFIRSLNVFDYQYTVYGLGEEWRGGNVKLYPGGGHKVNILALELEKYKNDPNKIIMFADTYDVVFNQPPEELLKKFKSFNAKIVFGAEKSCWPDESLANEYPTVGDNESRFLNSGGFIGYAPEVYAMITSSKITDIDDDQLFYTKIFLNTKLREELNLKLDVRSEIFQNLNGAIDDIIFETIGEYVVIGNNKTKTTPVLIHGNGPSKQTLNHLCNYIAKAWSINTGCLICQEEQLSFDADSENWPDVTIGLFVGRPTPFLKEFFEKVQNQNYPKKKLSVLVYNNVKYHTEQVSKFFEATKTQYASIKYISPDEDSKEYEARAEAIAESLRSKSKYYFSLDSTAHLDNQDTLKLLIQQNRPILAPIMIRPYSTWSNFWGAVSTNGFYARSMDYVDIIENKKQGIWNVPFISEALLMKSEMLKRYQIKFEDNLFDSDIVFTKTLRDQDAFMYATNMHYYGHLINSDNYNITLTRPEMYEIFDNYDDWTDKYIHPELEKYLEPNFPVEQPCPDVFWFPVVTEEFCTSLVDMMESFGKWSGGRNYDPRLPGGYENVPTVDIHMNQVGWEKHWLFFLRKFIQPMQRKLFIGYFHDPPSALLNFVVRYRPGEQDHLTPHHDASTYTTNIALNRPNIDFQGGGCRFVRYNCSVVDTRLGWTFIHPGRLTHYHEGLKVTSGTRYIMVSFVDP